MIILTIRNGLGNQLFIYAFAEYLKNKYPEQEIKLDFSDLHQVVNGRTTMQFNEVFEQPFSELSIDEIRYYTGKSIYRGREASNDHRIDRVIKRRVERLFKKKEKAIVIDEPIYWEVDEEFIQSILNYDFDSNDNYLLRGFWESTVFIEPVSEKIRETLKFKKPPIDSDLSKMIKANEAVSVHIRRGDYIRESEKKGYPRTKYNLCSEEYYKECIEEMSRKVQNPLFLFFSDDPGYVEETYKNIENRIIVKNHPDYDDLQMMSLCKHSILSNSTFAFWGAFLRKNPGITIAPKLHYVQMATENDCVKHNYFRTYGWEYKENFI